MKKALIVWGGWEGHLPDQKAAFYKDLLEQENVDVECTNDHAAFADADKLKSMDLIVPSMTMDKMEESYIENIAAAVAEGTGLAGCHGGMCDAFRENVLWAFMTGGTWVAHPGDAEVTYPVRFSDIESELIQGLDDFEVTSEQYYMHVDPAVQILATTPFPIAAGFHTTNGPVDMPVAWIKHWGQGRVYYNALGHIPDDINHGTAKEMIRRGFCWAARKTLRTE